MKHRIRIFSRHPSHNILRTNLPRLPFRSLVRFGSTTPLDRMDLIELNPISSIRISSNKYLMKKAFTNANIKTARWFHTTDINSIYELMDDMDIGFPIVMKAFYGSRGRGNTLLRDEYELEEIVNNNPIDNYIFEQYKPYLLEYRLHVTRHGCFYACRKALKSNTNSSDKWRRHSDNSVFLLDTNSDFMKPNSWDDIVNDCINALIEIGADILSFDVKVQSPTKPNGDEREYQQYIIIESNSASGMGHELDSPGVCASKYMTVIPELLMEKWINKI